MSVCPIYMFLPSVASVIHVCDRKAVTSTRGGERGNVWRRPALDRFVGENGVRFKDGTTIEVSIWNDPPACVRHLVLAIFFVLLKKV